MISDHAEMYGLMPQLLSGDPEVLATETGRRWYTQLTSGDFDTIFATAMEIIGTLEDDDPPINSPTLIRNAWQAYTALADRYNDPGTFTAIIGFEWTAIGGYNLHRNVLFRGGADVANQTLPFSQYDSKNPEDLWTYMEGFEEGTGSDVLAIPHNGNLSNGRMFTVESFDGQPLTAELAARRIRFEPLIEATQIKGDGESHPYLSPNDEFAGYEIWDRSNLNGTEAKTPDMLKFEYAREALKTGLKLEASLGVNPYKFGMIGSTDSHTSLATAEEDNFFGKHSGVEPEPHRWNHVVIEAPDPKFTVLGLAAGGERPRRGLGHREHPRGDLRRDEAQGDLRDHRAADDRALLRRVGFRRRGRHVPAAGRGGLPEGRADGRRPAGGARGQGADLPRRGDEGSAQRQPRPHPDRQGLARRERRHAGEGLRRRVERRPPAGTGRQAAAGRQHRRRRAGHLDQHDRRPRADRGLDRSRLRPGAVGLLLCQGHRNPDTALDGLRGAPLRRPDDRGRADDHPGARLHLADLVHAARLTGRRVGGTMTWLRRLIAEPLFQFAVAGGVIFAAYSAFPDENAASKPETIVVAAGEIAHIAAIFERTWQRPPTPEEMRGLLDAFVKEEVFSREGRKLGLDQDDIVIRRRLQQKMEFYMEPSAAELTPKTADLEAYLTANREAFRAPPAISFRHVFFDDRAGQGEAAAKAVLAELQDGSVDDVSVIGDPTMLPPAMNLTPAPQIANTFGSEFADALANAPSGDWWGPIRSAFGVHLVRVDERQDARDPQLSDVLDAVTMSWETAKRRETADRRYAELLNQYEVVIETPAEEETGSVRSER